MSEKDTIFVGAAADKPQYIGYACNLSADNVEFLAKQICLNLGLDPNVTVAAGYGDDMTPGEKGDQQFYPDILNYVPRWRLYRAKAAEALAAHVAILNLLEATKRGEI